MEMELDIEHNDEAAQATQVNEAGPPASQESSTDVESDQNKDGDFDITKLPKLPPLATLPKKTLAKKKTMSLNPAKKTSKKTIKGPTAMQVPTPFKPKPKSRPKKAADGVVSAAKKTQKSKVKQPPTATTTGTTNGAGGRVKERPNINRHAPLNLAQIQPT
jgi:outer membrane biosynthesis protein TonB